MFGVPRRTSNSELAHSLLIARCSFILSASELRYEEQEGEIVAEQEPLQIDIEGTPNPNSAKFVMNRTVVDETRSYFNVEMVTEEDTVAGVAKQLFAISGVRTLMFLNDFVTVSKEANADWNMIAEKTQEILEATYR